MSRATAQEQTFLTGLLLGELRQGALEGIMLEAPARRRAFPERVRRAVMMAGACRAWPGRRIERQAGLAPMTCSSSAGAADAGANRRRCGGGAGELGEAALDMKLDGARVQVHRSGDEVLVFSRSLNDVTAAVPEIVEAARALPASDLILDGEVISLSPTAARIPFR